MFSRRKRASSTVILTEFSLRDSVTNTLQPARGPHQGPPKPTAASTAAAQAFLANRASNGNLSSAAAAAALRSLTSSPTPVGEVQTKRMIRRGSQSSTGSAPGSAIRRQGSSGSMTERSFRDQSPGRAPNNADVPPPMPALPKAYASTPTGRQPRRPVSTEPPERVSSPQPKLPGGRGVSLDRGPGVMPARIKKAPKVHTPLHTIEDSAQDPRRSSVNFSRPMSPQTTPPVSPTQPKQANGNAQKKQNASTTAANLAVLSGAERSNIQHAVNEAVSAPVKKKKKAALQSTEGSHLAAGHGTAKPTGSAALHEPEDPETTITARTTFKGKKKVIPYDQEYASDSDVSEQSVQSDKPQNVGPRGRMGLSKQPSIVREDSEREAEEERELAGAAYPNTPNQNGAATSLVGKRIDEGTPKSNTSSKIVPKTDTLTPNLPSHTEEQQAKRSSLSPARQAHFSAQPIFETPASQRHQPPPRSVSPAKSAMKQSPSPRGPSPNGGIAGWNRPGHTASEISDEVSLASDEGFRPSRRKRVSFDDDAIIVGQAAQPDSPTSPVLSSPQDKVNKRGWFAFGKDRVKNQPHAVPEESDDVIRPVPVLPSFGSVRGAKRSTEPEHGQSIHSDGDVAHALRTLTSSSDQAVGGILSHDHEYRDKQVNASEPLPPEVTTVEGSGYHSDTESAASEVEEEKPQDTSVPSGSAHVPNHIVLPPEVPASYITSAAHETNQASSLEPVSTTTMVSAVPQIAVLPATPGQEIMEHGDRDSWLGMPGGFPTSDSLSRDASHGESEATSVVPVIEAKRAEVGIAEPEPEEAAAQHDPSTPAVGHVAANIRQQTIISEEEDSDSGNSIYSDAEEDLADLEGDGFGSINAIVESPMPAKKKRELPQPPPSPPPKSKARPQMVMESEESPEPPAGEGWDTAQTYWSSLSTSQKAKLEQAALQPESETSETQSIPAATPYARPKKAKKSIAQGPNNAVEPKGAITARPANSKAAAPITKEPVTKTAAKKPALKKSMREASPAQQPEVPAQPQTQMRSSMRNGSARSSGPSRMANSLRDAPSKKENPGNAYRSNEANGMPVPQTRTALQKKHRPVSTAVATSQSPVANGTMRARPASIASPVGASTSKPKAAMAPKPDLRRQLSNGSDSDSSFKRARGARNQGKEGGYTMRRSMRAASVAKRPRSTYTPSNAPRQADAFSVRSLSPTGNSRRPGSMGTMRTSLRQAPTPAQPERAKSPSRSLFGRKPKAMPASEPVPTKRQSRFSSRFGDSSDEEDGGPKTYSSRFADSSDEDEPAPSKLTPVRGIPKRIDEGDSTDLEDSDDEAKPKATTAKRPPQPEPITIPERSIEGAVLASGTLRRSGSGREALSPVRVDEKKKRSFFGNLGRRKDKGSKVGKVDFESAARRDTPLERTKIERTALSNPPAERPRTPADSNTPIESPTASPKSPKLQRRNPQRVTSDSWPLPPPIPESPSTTVRPNTSDGTNKQRPDLGERGFSAVSATTGKKKRFPMLRKAFGLHD